MPGEPRRPPTLITLPHTKGMKPERDESEAGELGDDVTEDTGPEEDKQVFTGLKARTLSESDSNSKPSVSGGHSQ